MVKQRQDNMRDGQDLVFQYFCFEDEIRPKSKIEE